MRNSEQIKDLEERIQDFDRAIRRFEAASEDPIAWEFQQKLDAMKEELAQLLGGHGRDGGPN